MGDRSRSCGEEVAWHSLEVVLRSLLCCAVAVGIGYCDAVVSIAVVVVVGDIAAVGFRMACSRYDPITMVSEKVSTIACTSTDRHSIEDAT